MDQPFPNRPDSSDPEKPEEFRSIPANPRRRWGIWIMIGRFFGGIYFLAKLSLLCAVVFAACGAGAYYLIRQEIRGTEVQVPNLTGYPLDQALERLYQHQPDLSLRLDGSEFSEMVAEGEIMSQFPPPGMRVKTGSVVRVRVSRGNSMVSNPDVVGINYQDAGIALRQAGLVEGHKSFLPDDAVRKDLVISQSPPAGAALERDTVVNLLVSLGPPTPDLTMPDFSGLTLVEAQELIGRLGLQMPVIQEVAQPGTDNGIVVGQSPPPRTVILTETSISLRVVNNLGLPAIPATPPVNGFGRESGWSALPDTYPTEEEDIYD